MQYKYSIVQENINDKSKVTFEFTAVDEDEFVDNISSFMNMIGWNEGGRLEMVNTSSLYDDIDSEVNEYDSNYRNPEVEGFMNFEFPLHEEGKGQMDYTFTSADADSIAEKHPNSLYATWPFPSDRPSQPTYRVDSIYTTNGDEPTYYGA